MWEFLNWALGFRALGCDVIWAEEIKPTYSLAQIAELVAHGRKLLAPFGLADRLAILPLDPAAGRPPDVDGCVPFEEVVDADLLVSFAYSLPQNVVDAFRRTAVIDFDPGLVQFWVHRGMMKFGRYQHHFTTGETVGQPGSGIPDLGVSWHYVPPCVALDWWPVARARHDAPFTTVTHWTGEWMEDDRGAFDNAKRAGFLPFLSLPALTREKLELAAFFGDWDHDERPDLIQHGWSVKDPTEVTSTPDAYQHYIQESRGEFSCVKPSCVRMQNAWLSVRTLCYMASGKPAVVQHTGPSRYLPDARGLFRFTTLDEAARMLDTIGKDYDMHCRDARALVEERFDSRKVAAPILEKALN